MRTPLLNIQLYVIVSQQQAKTHTKRNPSKNSPVPLK